MKRMVTAVVAVVGAGLAMIVAAPVVLLAGGEGQQQAALAPSAGCTASLDPGSVSTLTAEQQQNAAVIVGVSRTLGIPARGAVVALATALQESGLRNLTYGDRDSVGLFQQRPSMGWGSVTELTTPAVSATKFYTALGEVPGWQQMPVTVAAQTVQRSGFPLAYAKWEPLAGALVSGSGSGGGQGSPGVTGCAEVSVASLPSGPTGVMLEAALGVQGSPYVFGATGPDAFDCSGLIVWAWRQAGYRLTLRTADQMFRAATPVVPGQEQPGDLLFGAFDDRVSGAGHVMIVVRPGLAVEAPSSGKTVRVREYTVDSGRRLGRLPATTFQPLGQQG